MVKKNRIDSVMETEVGQLSPPRNGEIIKQAVGPAAPELPKPFALPDGFAFISAELIVKVARIKPGGTGMEIAPLTATVTEFTRDAWERATSFDGVVSAILQLASPERILK